MAVKVSIHKGTRDFLPQDIRRREHVIGIIRRVYESRGFEPLEAPAIENLDTLLGKYGEEGDRLTSGLMKAYGGKIHTKTCRAPF